MEAKNLTLSKQPKTRQHKRYGLPLDADLRVGKEPIRTSVVNIATGGCLLKGKTADALGSLRDTCTVKFRLVKGYPSSLEWLVPTHPLKGAILLVRQVDRTENHFEWSIKFDHLHDGQFVEKLAHALHRRRLPAWHCPAYQKQTVDFIGRYRQDCPLLTRGRIDKWLEQICDDQKDSRKTDNMRNLALEILGTAVSRYYYSHPKCVKLAKQLWSEILKLPGVDHNPERVRLFPLGREAKSGYVTLYTMRVANDLPPNICQEGFTALYKRKERDKQREFDKLENVKWLILVDDFVGTGSTAKRGLHELTELASMLKKYTSFDLLQGKKIALASFAGFFQTHQPKTHSRLDEYDDVITIDQLREDRDTVEHIVAKDKNSILQALYQLADRKCLYCSAGKSLPHGYDNLGALVSFYYSTPNNSLPILWSERANWQPVLPPHQYAWWRSLKSPEPEDIPLVNLATRLSLETALGGHNRIIICANSGFGKTNLAAHVAKSVREKLCRSVIWHEFARFCSVDSFFCHTGWCLAQRCSLHEVKERFLAGDSEDRIIEVLIRDLNVLKPVLFLGGIDRIRIEDKDLQRRLVQIIAGLHEDVHVVCTFRTSEEAPPAWLTAADTNWYPSPLKNLDDKDVEEIIKSVVGVDRYKKMSDDTKTLIIHRASGHPLGAWLLASLYLRLNADEKKFDDTLRTWDGAKPPLNEAARSIFDRLDEDLKLFLLAASVFMCPFEVEQIEALYEKARIGQPQNQIYRNVHECIKTLKTKWKTPFLFKAEGGRFEMPKPLRERIHDRLAQDEPKMLLMLEEETANLFASLETQELGHKLDFIEIAYHHFLNAGKINRAGQLLVDEQDTFTSGGRRERLLKLIQDVIDTLMKIKARKLDQENVKFVYLRAKLLGRLTRHAELWELCNKEFPNLFKRLPPLWRALFHFLEARVNASMRRFKEAWECFDKAEKETLTHLKKNTQDTKAKTLLLKIYLRRCQTKMSQGDYLGAWKELDLAVKKLKKNAANLSDFAHELAVACRHVYTLLYLNGDYVDALGWAEDARALNERLSDYEGLAVMQYKLARAWLALKNVEKAHELCTNALNILQAHVPGGRWWKMAFLETQALIRINQARQKDIAPRDKEDLLKRAEQRLKEAEQLSYDMLEGKKISVRPHLSEIYQAQASLAFERAESWRKYWDKALECFYPEGYEGQISLENALQDVEDKFRLSELIYDLGYFKFYDEKSTKENKKDAVDTLKRSARILKYSLLEASQKKPLKLLATIGEKLRQEVTQLEALYRSLEFDVKGNRIALKNIRKSLKLVKNLVKSKYQATDTTDIEKVPGLRDIADVRTRVEKNLSQLIDKYYDLGTSQNK